MGGIMATFLRFEEIEAWQKAHQLTRAIYRSTGQRIFVRDFGLRDQMRRAAVSVMSNISEGFERGGAIEFARFLRMAKGSLGELTAQLYVALDEHYIDQETFVRLRTLADETSHLLGGLIRYLRKADNGRPLSSHPSTRHP